MQCAVLGIENLHSMTLLTVLPLTPISMCYQCHKALRSVEGFVRLFAQVLHQNCCFSVAISAMYAAM